METTTVQCEECKKPFERQKSRVERDRKNGRRTFCSLSCNRKKQNKERTDYSIYLDEFSPFRSHFKGIRQRSVEKELEVAIDLRALKIQWDKQNGICPYTGRKMLLAKSTNDVKTATPNTASVDRIDSDKGYPIDNIQWVCLMAQYAKNIFTEQELITFCEDVANNKKQA